MRWERERDATALDSNLSVSSPPSVSFAHSFSPPHLSSLSMNCHSTCVSFFTDGEGNGGKGEGDNCWRLFWLSVTEGRRNSSEGGGGRNREMVFPNLDSGLANLSVTASILRLSHSLTLTFSLPLFSLSCHKTRWLSILMPTGLWFSL